MRPLVERWPGIASLPFVELARTPTPVERLSGARDGDGAELWCKRDDRTAPPYGGNKVRKLQWLLGAAGARGCDALITTGAFGSHHVLATALYGARLGFEVHAVLLAQPMTAHVADNLRADLAARAILHPARGYAGVAGRMLALAASMRLRGRRPMLIGPGGSSPLGCVGYVEAGLELAEQIGRGDCPEPSHVFVAAGSGGTVAGLAVGLAAAGITSEVVGVRVAHRVAINRAHLGRLIRRCVRLLSRADRTFPDVTRAALAHLVIDGSQIGAGYGSPTPAGEAARRRAAELGLRVDPTYTAKAFAAALAHRRDPAAPALYVHTLSGADMGPLLEGAPPLPPWAR